MSSWLNCWETWDNFSNLIFNIGSDLYTTLGCCCIYRPGIDWLGPFGGKTMQNKGQWVPGWFFNTSLAPKQLHWSYYGDHGETNNLIWANSQKRIFGQLLASWVSQGSVLCWQSSATSKEFQGAHHKRTSPLAVPLIWKKKQNMFSSIYKWCIWALFGWYLVISAKKACQIRKQK